MTDESVREAEAALDAHDAFERLADAFAVTTTPFDATVQVVAADDAVRYRVTVRVPTIDAVVADEDVAPVVLEGWFETFERRLEGVGGATRADPREPTATLDEETDEVLVESSFESPRPERGAADAKAVVDYVEGTFVQGIIPGYEYREPAAGLLDRAGDRSKGEGVPPL